MRMRINRNPDFDMKDRPITPQRRLLLDTLREAQGHLDARELYRLAIEKDPRISLATVYRNLQLFKELGLIDERRLDKVYCYYEIKRPTEHYHLVCQSCGRVIELESPAITEVINQVKHDSDFDVTRVVLYLEGYCRKCKDEEKGLA